ncbi:hypothetical protein ABFS83_03G038100 [Erythranthe nasuta]
MMKNLISLQEALRIMRPIFCGNLEFDARQSEIERLFRRYGKVFWLVLVIINLKTFGWFYDPLLVFDKFYSEF